MAAGAISQVPSPPMTATIDGDRDEPREPAERDRHAQDQERHGVAREVPEPDVQYGRKGNADKPLDVTRADSRRVHVAGEEVDDLEHPHDGDQRRDEREPGEAAITGPP